MGSTIKIGRISGISIGIHPTWLIAVIFLAWTSRQIFEFWFPSWSAAEQWTAGIIGTLALFASVLVHELAHSITAQRLGHRVEGITLFIFGGVSQIHGRYKSARNEFMVAFAGPLSSLIIGALAFGAWFVLRPDGDDPSLPLGITFQLAYMNVLLGIFNLLPGFPLDGGRVLRSLVWGWSKNERTATRVATGVGSLVAWGLIGFGVYQFLNDEIVGGIWMVFIGLFLQSAARGERQAEQARDSIGHVPIGPAIQRTQQFAQADDSLAVVMERYVMTGMQRIVPVVENGQPIGYFTPADARRFSPADWPNLSVGGVIRRQAPYAVQVSADAVEVLEELQSQRIPYAMVLDAENNVVGAVGQAQLESLIRFRHAADGAPGG